MKTYEYRFTGGKTDYSTWNEVIDKEVNDLAKEGFKIFEIKLRDTGMWFMVVMRREVLPEVRTEPVARQLDSAL